MTQIEYLMDEKRATAQMLFRLVETDFPRVLQAYAANKSEENLRAVRVMEAEKKRLEEAMRNIAFEILKANDHRVRVERGLIPVGEE